MEIGTKEKNNKKPEKGYYDYINPLTPRRTLVAPFTKIPNLF